MGQEKGEKSMSYLLSNDHWLRRRRPGAASGAEQQRLEVHRSFRRHAAVVEEHRRRMGVEDRVASRLRYMELISKSTFSIQRDHPETFQLRCPTSRNQMRVN